VPVNAFRRYARAVPAVSLRTLALCGAAALCGCARQPPAEPRPGPSASDAAPVASVAPAAATPAPALVDVQVLAINDFHGHLEPPLGENGVVVAPAGDPVASLPGATTTDAGVVLVPAGGVAVLAAHVARLRAENPNTVVVSAGDLTGASPLVSSLFHDEPTVLAMNRLGLDFEGVGNHDFDRGIDELRRLQTGGCFQGNCDGGTFRGATFEYLAANVRDATGKTVFPPYAMRDFAGARVAFIGETLAQTPSVTSARAIEGLTFADEAETANALVPEIRRQGAAAIVLLLHQGGMQHGRGTYDSCEHLGGDLLDVLPRLDPAIRVVVSAHTHQAYDCVVDGRVVTSAGSYGRLITKIDLTIDPAAHALVHVKARNVPVTRDVAPDAATARLLAPYEEKARSIVERVVGYVERDLTGSARRAGSASCETSLGDVIADAMQASTGADVAFMNPGGIRADLVASHPGRAPHAVTYGDAFDVQPFQNTLVTMTLRGAEILALLERQFGTRDEPRILQVSKGFGYRYHYDRAARTARISDVRIAGKPLDPARDYRVTVPSFLAGGGDSFASLARGRDRREGAVDVDALVAYLGKNGPPAAPLDAPKGVRITGDGCR
jgi:5'-nucleotidase